MPRLRMAQFAPLPLLAAPSAKMTNTKLRDHSLPKRLSGRNFLHFEPPGANTHAWVVRGKKWIIRKSVLDLRRRRHLLCVPSHRDSDRHRHPSIANQQTTEHHQFRTSCVASECDSRGMPASKHLARQSTRTSARPNLTSRQIQFRTRRHRCKDPLAASVRVGSRCIRTQQPTQELQAEQG